MSVSPGQAVSAAVVNAGFMSRTSNTSTVGAVDLSKPTGSGSVVTDLQQVINNLITVAGMLNQNDTSLTYDAVNVTDGSSLKTAIEELDASIVSVASSFAAIFSSNNVWTGSNTFSSVFNFDYVDNAATGADAVLTGLTKTVVRLTGGLLTSVAGIENPASNRLLILQNATGSNVVIKHNDPGVDPDQILTLANNADFTFPNNTALLLYYDTIQEAWRVFGGGGGGGGGGGAGSIQWNAPEGTGATLIEEFGIKSFEFEKDGDTKVVALIQVPDDFNSGFQPQLRVVSYADSASNVHAYELNVYLIKPTLQGIDSTTYLETITTSDLGLGGANIISASDTPLTDISGEVGGELVTAGDYLRIEISRTTPVLTETTANSRLLFGSMGVTFA